MEKSPLPQLQTRTEHSRSLEDADRLRALHTLTDLGLLTPLSEIESYHGRVTKPGEEAWKVDPAFTNGSNDTGNYNVNERPTLYTGERLVAEEFATQRAHETVRPLYMGTFEEKVRKYSEEDKQAWLTRRNKENKDWWASLKPNIRDLYHAGPDGDAPAILPADLVKESEVYNEAKALEQAASPEEKQAIWDDISKLHSAEVHDIVSVDSDASVLDFSFEASKLTAEETER